MKNMKKFFISVLSICMLLTLSCSSAFAATPYTYKVTVYGGNKGTVEGKKSVELEGLSAGTSVDLSKANVKVTDDKYYWKGFRQSGRDKREILPQDSAVVKVTGDTDYVVAYGITSQRVAYTVRYQDADGNTLADSNTYYGDVGDRPVVAYLYIENYIPQAYAVTKTLVANESENVFTFTYTPGATDRVVTNTIVNTTTATTAGTTTGTATGTGAAADTTTATTAQAATADANTNATNALDNATDNTTTNTDEATPQAVQNLDEDTPTSNVDASSNVISPMMIAIIVGVIAVLALAGLGFFLYKKRSKGVK